MLQLSSSTTLPLRIFLPILTLSFLGMLVLSVFFADISDLLGVSVKAIRIFLPGLYLVVAAILYRTVWQLRRIDADANYIYVSNYFKTLRYAWKDVSSVNIKQGLLAPATIELKESGTWGQRIKFIPSRQRMRKFTAEQPEVASLFH